MNFLLYLIFAPLHQLYFNGPSIGGIGFWSGAASEDICSSISNVPAGFWSGNMNECEALLHKRFIAFVIAFIWVTCGIVILKAFNLTIHYYFITRPLLQFMRNGPKCESAGPNVPKITNGDTNHHETVDRPKSVDKMCKNNANNINCKAVE